MLPLKQRGFVSPKNALQIAIVVGVVAVVFFGFREFRSLYIDKGKLQVMEQYRDIIDAANKETQDLKRQLEEASKTKADDVAKAVQDALAERQSTLDDYAKELEAYKTRNASLLSQLRTKPSDRPVVRTEPGTISDVAVNTINRLISDTNNRTHSAGGSR